MKKMVSDEWTALGGQGPHNLVAVEDACEWNGDRRGPRIGTYYTILRQIDLEKVRVLVRDTAPVVDSTAFQGLAITQLPRVSFEQFTATISVNFKTYHLSIYAEATAIKLAQPTK